MADENVDKVDCNKKDDINDAESDCSEECYTIDELSEIYDSADAVLGGSDPNNCSYSLGYVKRQALYACVTCTGPHLPNSEVAGVCLGCANKCHENHQLVELYTKRSFRCDCGNKKFPVPCSLLPNKEDKNSGNSYNHNFRGVYCTCNKPYPDPDDDDEMIQCIVCEDWFHSRHAFGHHADKLVMGDGKDVDTEMICAGCTQTCDFLRYYENLRVPVRVKEEVAGADNKEARSDSRSDDAVSTDVKPNAEEVVPLSSNPTNKTADGNVGVVADLMEETKIGVDDKTKELKAELDVESRTSAGAPSPQAVMSSEAGGGSSSCQETKDSGIVSDASQGSSSNVFSDATKCLLKTNSKVELVSTATLWIAGWRSKICKCDPCVNMYFKLGVGFITDEEDTLFAYEEIGQKKIEEEQKEDDEKFTNMWSKLDHVAQLEAMISINEMKEQLREFLQKHNGKVVRKRDAEEFAEELKAKRARRMNGDGIPPKNCG